LMRGRQRKRQRQQSACPRDRFSPTLLGDATRLVNSYEPDQTFSAESVRSCYLTKVYFVSYGRNAYNWTWTEKYPGDAAFHKNLASAKAHAEARRVQGSRFYIDEVPAPAFVAKTGCLVVTEINTPTPLERYTAIRPTSNRVSHIAEAFASWRPNTIQKFTEASDLVLPLVPFKRFHSQPQGQTYNLAWRERDTRKLRLTFVEAALGHIQKWLSEQQPKKRQRKTPKPNDGS
jgi:hypothetical protein